VERMDGEQRVLKGQHRTSAGFRPAILKSLRSRLIEKLLFVEAVGRVFTFTKAEQAEDGMP